MNVNEARSALRSDLQMWINKGIRFEPGCEPLMYVSDDPRYGAPFEMAMDALPALGTEANSAVPALFLNFVDPQTYEYLFSPLKVAEMFDRPEQQRGTWTDVSAMFPVAEITGEVSSYDDYTNTGVSGVNYNWPQREAYLFQTFVQYGELEVARASVARQNIVADKERAASSNLMRFANYTYAFGVNGSQNYGLVNDPNLSASLTPAPKANGGTAWVVNGVLNASATEILTDVQSIVQKIISQANGTIGVESPMTLGYPPDIAIWTTATNSFNTNIKTLLKENFPKMKLVESISQFSVLSATNPQGIAAGNLVQIVVTEVEGQQTGYASYNEKLRSHPIIREPSAFKQKKTSGTWGSIIRMPMAIASMVGC